MPRSEAIALIRKIDPSWIAAIAIVDTGSSNLDITSANSEDAARRWVVDMAAAHGISENEIDFKFG